MNRRDLLRTIPAAALPFAASPASAKARLRSAICAYSFRKPLGAKSMTYDDIVRMAADLGVDGLDLTVYWFPSMAASFLLPLRRLAYKSGVEIYSISIRTDMCRPTDDGRQAEVRNITEWIDAAEKLGAGHIRVFGGTVPKGSTEDAAAGWAADTLRRAAGYAGSKGVILGLENHGGITESASRILEIVKKVDSPWVGVNLDTGNFRTDSYAQIQQLIPHAVNVQLKTEIRGPAGQREEADWKRLLTMLASGGYRGYVALEYEEDDDPVAAVPKQIGRLQGLLKAM